MQNLQKSSWKIHTMRNSHMDLSFCIKSKISEFHFCKKFFKHLTFLTASLTFQYGCYRLQIGHINAELFLFAPESCSAYSPGPLLAALAVSPRVKNLRGFPLFCSFSPQLVNKYSFNFSKYFSSFLTPFTVYIHTHMHTLP